MSRFSRVVVLVVGLMSVFAALAGTAGASTWSNFGDTNFTATTGPGTLVAGSATLNCSGGTATGVAPVTAAGPNYTLTGNIAFRPCTLSIFNPRVNCAYSMTGAPPITAGVTRFNIAVNCIDSALGCRITGTIPGDYTNATMVANGFFRVRGTTGLTVQPGCILSGTARLAPDPMTFTVNAGTGGGLVDYEFGPVLVQP